MTTLKFFRHHGYGRLIRYLVLFFLCFLYVSYASLITPSSLYAAEENYSFSFSGSTSSTTSNADCNNPDTGSTQSEETVTVPATGVYSCTITFESAAAHGNCEVDLKEVQFQLGPINETLPELALNGSKASSCGWHQSASTVKMYTYNFTEGNISALIAGQYSLAAYCEMISISYSGVCSSYNYISSNLGAPCEE